MDSMAGSQPPPPAPYAPPPQKSGGWVKWVVIGCGGILLIALICMGSCLGLGFYAAKKGVEIAKAWTEIIQKTESDIKSNKYVQQRVGRVNTIVPTNERRHNDHEIPSAMHFRVTGDKGTGTVELEIEVLDMKPVVKKKFLYFKGKRVDMDTGAETEAPEPNVPTRGSRPDEDE